MYSSHAMFRKLMSNLPALSLSDNAALQALEPGSQPVPYSHPALPTNLPRSLTVQSVSIKTNKKWLRSLSLVLLLSVSYLLSVPPWRWMSLTTWRCHHHIITIIIIIMIIVITVTATTITIITITNIMSSIIIIVTIVITIVIIISSLLPVPPWRWMSLTTFT